MRALLLLLTVALLCCAQTTAKKPVFDTASVKPAPNTPRGEIVWRGGPGTASPGRFTMPAATLAQIIEKAYDVSPDQVIGPNWIGNREDYTYSLAATMPPDTTDDQFHAMLQNLLAERFRLRLHHVTQTRPGYELVVAEGGPKIHQWTPPNPGTTFKPGVDAKGFPRLDPSFGPGASIVVAPRSSGIVPIRMTRRVTVAAFCRELGADINMSEGLPYDDKPPRVVDRTGLTGVYEFNLEFAGALRSAARMPLPPESDSGTAAVANDPIPNIFTALEKQLGLKLRKLRDVPVEVLIVDSADKVPAAN